MSTELPPSRALEIGHGTIFAPTPKAAKGTLEFFTQINIDHALAF
jgi:hypothetical protein